MPREDLPIINFEQESVDRARAMTAEQRLIAGAELFDTACMIARAGIRADHPEYTDDQVLEELRRRIRIGKRLRNMPDDSD